MHPNLDILRVPWMLDQDIYNDNRPWICLGLTELAVSFGLVTLISQRLRE